MVLYTCGQQKRASSLGHPCGRAARALDEAGYRYELRTVGGYRLLPWTRRGDARGEIKAMTGQKNVPVLLLDDGSTVVGSSRIVAWAREHPEMR